VTTAEPVLLTERSGAVTTLVINRPKQLNAISPTLVQAMNAALDELPSDTRVLVITGRGRAFSAGGDLAAVLEFAASSGRDPRDGVEAFHGSISALLRRIELLPIPALAAVNGIAVAGGLEIAAACDLVIAAETATFGDGHANYGLLPAGGGSVRLPRRIGITRAKYLMYTANTIPAATMEQWGLVCQVVPDAELSAAADKLAATLATRSRDGLRRMKTLIDTGAELSAEDALRFEQTVAAEHTHSADYLEGLTAFRERRAARF
jgi:enoyl-CoA hydratase